MYSRRAVKGRDGLLRDGQGGLGDEVLRALQGVDVGRGFQAGLSIVLLAIIIDRMTGAMAARQQRVLKT